MSVAVDQMAHTIEEASEGDLGEEVPEIVVSGRWLFGPTGWCGIGRVREASGQAHAFFILDYTAVR